MLKMTRHTRKIRLRMCQELRCSWRALSTAPKSARTDVAPTFRACPERGEGPAHAELKLSVTNTAACHDMLEKERVSHNSTKSCKNLCH